MSQAEEAWGASGTLHTICCYFQCSLVGFLFIRVSTERTGRWGGGQEESLHLIIVARICGGPGWLS